MFFFTICLIANEEGSCTWHDYWRYLCLGCTCGCCDIGKDKQAEAKR